MNNTWNFALDFVWLSLFIGIGSVLKARIGFLKKFIIPTSILAGFIGLLLGTQGLNIIPFQSSKFGNLVYHLMAIGFIALSLKERKKKKDSKIFSSGIYIVSTYLVQGIVGFMITLILINTLYPDIFPAFGLLLPLGYGQGPGQAFSIGSQWEALGFNNGGNIGLTFSTFGFLWASIIGVPFMNYLIKKSKKYEGNEHKKATNKPITEKMEPGEIPLSESLDKISIQFTLIGIIYLLTYLTISGANRVLITLGTYGKTFAQLLWGFHFIIGSIYAIIMRRIFDILKEKKIILYNYPNNYLLQRIAGASFDFMITASIAAISIYALKEQVIPILIITTAGGICTILHTIIMCKWIFKKNTLENIVGFYGMQTGTISTAMALLKGIDPNFNTDVSENLVMGSAIALFFGFPLMLILNIPIVGYVNNNSIMYFYTLILFVVYLAFLYFLIYKNVSKQHK